MTDIAQLVERIKALEEYVDTYPLPDEVRETMTIRELYAIFAKKQEALGLDFEAMDEVTRRNEDVRYWMEQLGMAYDHRELLASEYHKDLPLNHPWMEEYEPMREAEEAFWAAQKPGPVDETPLYKIVADHMPNRA